MCATRTLLRFYPCSVIYVFDFEVLSTTFITLNRLKLSWLLFWDFNLICWHSSDRMLSQFLNRINFYAFRPFHVLRARVTSTSATRLDVILTNSVASPCTTDIIIKTTFLTILQVLNCLMIILMQGNVRHLSMSGKVITPGNLESFQGVLHHDSWWDVYNCTKADNAYNKFNTIFCNHSNQCFPTVPSNTKSGKTTLKWITPEIIKTLVLWLYILVGRTKGTLMITSLAFNFLSCFLTICRQWCWLTPYINN